MVNSLLPFGAVLVASLCGVTQVLEADAEVPANLVLVNGKIVTVDKAETVADAMAVGGGKVLYVGDADGARDLAGPETRIVDLEGRMVLPGLIDSHTHPVSAAMIEFDHEIPDMRSVADVLAYVRARAKAVGSGEWIVIQQVFITRLEEKALSHA